MKKVIGIGLVGVMLMAVVGCQGMTRAMTTTDKSSIYNEANGTYLDVNTITVRDRSGTEMHHVVVLDKDSKVVTSASASGRGIIPGMTDGTLPALIHTGGAIGMGAVWPSDNYSGGNAAAGGAVASQNQGQAQGQLQGQAQGQLQGQSQKNYFKPTNVNVNKNSGGWTPPGQDKK